MGVCRYCHQKAGWFRDAHNACVQKANAGVESIRNCVADAVIQSRQYSDVSATIDKLIADAAVQQNQARQALISGWSQGAEQSSKAEPISDERYLAVIKFLQAAGLSEEEVFAKTDGSWALSYSNLTWRVLHDRITPWQIPSSPPPGRAPTGMTGWFNFASFNLPAGEVRVWGLTNVWLRQEVTTSSYVGGYGGPSMRVANGLWYRFGAYRGHREEFTSLQDVDAGVILITTRAIYFGAIATGGRGLSFRLPFNQVIRFKPYSDAVGICKNGGREQIFAPQRMVWDDGVITGGPKDIGYFLFNLLQALAARDSTANNVALPRGLGMMKLRHDLAGRPATLSGHAKLCPRCGKEYGEGRPYCQYCGFRGNT